METSKQVDGMVMSLSASKKEEAKLYYGETVY